jgi:hypothetical protein
LWAVVSRFSGAGWDGSTVRGRIHSAPIDGFIFVRTNCLLLGARRRLRLSKQFCTFPSWIRSWACSCFNSSPLCAKVPTALYSDTAIATTMLGKRPHTALPGEVEVLGKRPKLCESARSISHNEAVLSQPSILVVWHNFFFVPRSISKLAASTQALITLGSPLLKWGHMTWIRHIRVVVIIIHYF